MGRGGRLRVGRQQQGRDALTVGVCRPAVGVHEPAHTRPVPVGRSGRRVGGGVSGGVDQAQRHRAPMAVHRRGPHVLCRMNGIRHEGGPSRQPVEGQQGRRDDTAQFAEGGDHECSIEGIFNVTHRGRERSKGIVLAASPFRRVSLSAGSDRPDASRPRPDVPMQTPSPPDLDLAALLDPRHPIKADTAEWARGHLDPGNMVERDQAMTFFAEAWQACADRGILGSAVAAEHGGSGDGLVETLLKLEGLGLGCRDNGLGFAVASQVLSFQGVVARSGTEAQRRSVLPAACAGQRIGAVAMTEEGSGSDTFALSTRATRTADGWVLDGTKRYVTLAPVADDIVTFAVTDPDAGPWGISAFLVPTDRPGITCSPSRAMMGLRTAAVGDVVLAGCEVTEADLLGSTGSGAAIFKAAVDGERALILAPQLGAAERMLDEAVERSRTRVQFGRPIGQFQAVAHRLADLKVRLDAARLLVYRAAVLLGRKGRAGVESSVAHLFGQEAIAEIALGAARVHGARGYMTEGEVERDVRDALGATVSAGTAEMQRNLIAAFMAVGGSGRG